jgi:type I restriction-modification system DNA methylase subunit
MASNRSIEYHQQWIGYLNPTGLVFSPNALDDAQAVINEGVISEQKEFLNLVTKTVNDNTEFTGFENVRDLFFKVLNWRESDLNSEQTLITQYSFSHPQFDEVVSPTYVAKVNDEKVILIQELDHDDFDKTANTEDAWNSSPHFKFERLLREKQISTGFIVSKEKLRLIFAPRGESSGYIDFPFKILYQPSGRLVFAAFRELLSDAKVFNSPKGQSLIEILELSRKYQAQVSIELSGQVLAALYELLRGFQTANDDESGKLLEKTLKENPQLIYEGLLTTLLRMVFIMYAEDRNLLATDEVYQSSYSLAGLYERLRQDEAQNPDTMDSRYGAWAHLISLFRLIYDGAEYDSEKGKVALPARHGHLFDPNIYLFLEGRDSKDQLYNKAPKISDGVIFRVLKNLLVLNGERISYRTLDVEQIGSVYETMMGFELGRAEGETVALKPAKSHGAPLPINLDEILATKDKAKKLSEVSELKLSDKAKKEFNECKTIEELERVLDKRIDRRATPFRLSKDAMVLFPSEARRKSGSHYTPRELTEPIVRVALEPVLKNLGDKPTPEQILALKICDPAMGSGAFLVETCRQLSEKLFESWTVHKVKIDVSADEDELLHARRLIAQKCLYGVDKNHMAVNLAKLSLWLVTLAKEHSFSFLDHNLKHGDSLVGLTNKQIMSFDYMDRQELPLFQYVKDQLNEAVEAREEIIHATDEQNYEALKEIEVEYLNRLEPLRLVGNLALKCFFDGKNERERDNNLEKHSLAISNHFSANDYERLKKYCSDKLQNRDSRFIPFHWELEFPEIFTRDNLGFDCFVGNPPFIAGTKISENLGDNYNQYLVSKFSGASKKSDISAYFLRNCFNLLKRGGTLGLITTNTISQGDSKRAGIDFILENGAQIYSAYKDILWPGEAAVFVNYIFISKENKVSIVQLNGKQVDSISSFLDLTNFGSIEPKALLSRKDISFIGVAPYGVELVLDLEKGKNFLKDKKNEAIIRPCVGGQEFNYLLDSNLFERYIVNFKEMSESQARTFSEVFQMLESELKPKRLLMDKVKYPRLVNEWWKFWHGRQELFSQIEKNKPKFLWARARVTNHNMISRVNSSWTPLETLVLFVSHDFAFFSVIQSTVHEAWVRKYSSTLKTDIRYVVGDCFETFPFPEKYFSDEALKSIGEEYFNFRAQLMIKLSEGLTKIYNRFHNPENTDDDIKKLRMLHQKLDKCVFDAYGWTDLNPNYSFILDYEIKDDSRRSKKPYRFKFTPELHEEILDRLLNLNQKKYEEEVRLGFHKR